jgi:hypothetical protein
VGFDAVRSRRADGLAPGAYRLVMGGYQETFQIADGDLSLAIT